MSAETRFAKLKLELPPAPKPIAVYKPLVIVDKLVYVSGHGPLKPDKTLITGRVGADLTLEEGKAAARQVGLAILATLRDQLGSLDEVQRWVASLSRYSFASFLLLRQAGIADVLLLLVVLMALRQENAAHAAQREIPTSRESVPAAA